MSIDELYEMATTNCYMKAAKALEHGLIGGVIA